MAELTRTSDDSMGDVVPLALEWHVPETLAERYANNIVTTFGEHECEILFFQVRTPIILGSSEERVQAAKAMKSVRAECVARIIVPKALVPEIIATLQLSLDKNIAIEKKRAEKKAGEE